MKKVFFALFSAVLCVMAFTSCEPIVSGDFIYSLTPADSSTGSSMSYQMSGAEDTMAKCLSETATHLSIGHMTFQKTGELTECDKAMKAAFEKGVNQIEGADDYNSFYVLTDVTIQLTRSDWEDSSKKIVVAEHTFK
ncbi:MAG: hypothetical protein ACI392_00650 [Paludibacteraceae bacterium]